MIERNFRDKIALSADYLRNATEEASARVLYVKLVLVKCMGFMVLLMQSCNILSLHGTLQLFCLQLSDA